MKASSEVLARKYRPRRFEDLIGQETISQTLSLALDSDRLSHAYLLSGLRGSGKTSTARIFAKALICEKGPTSNPCDVCSHCLMANESRHMDIIEMDAASSRKIDDIRDLIEHTKYRPATGKYKIFIIDEVHMLTKEAFNALLKTLEEPPAYVKFILATTDPLKLPATILSRTQHFRFKKISHQNIVSHLAHILHLEQIEYQKEALDILARSGSGSLRDTLTLLDQAIIYSKNFVDVKTVTDMLGLIDPEFINRLFAAVFAKDYPTLIAYTKALEDYEAEMVVDELIAYLKERLYNPDKHFSTLVLERFFRILSDSKSLFAINADGTFTLGLLFFKMVEALRVKEIDQMIESLENEVKRPASVNFAPPSPQSVETPSVPAAAAPQQPSEVPAPEAAAVQTPMAEPVQSAAQQPVAAEPAVAAQVDNTPDGEMLFEELCQKISDRSAILGECFSNQVHFISYENDVLTWESCADEACKQQLRHGYSVIKQFVREVYGFETQIAHQPCSKNEEESLPDEESSYAPEPQRAAPAQHEQSFTSPPQPKQSVPEPSSMVEEAEVGSGSCVSGCDSDDLAAQEFDGNAILDEPMVLKAKELFEATKITIQNKI